MATSKKKKTKHKKPKQNKGHYCRICGEHKANEKFSGKGHATHICKACHALPLERRNEIENLNKIDRIAENFFISKENLKRLKKYANDSRYPQSSAYARGELESFYFRMDAYHGNTPSHETFADPVIYSELDESLKKEIRERLYELIGDFLGYSDYLPDKDDIDEMLTALCEEISESLNYHEPEPYSVVELYENIIPFDHNKSFDENIQDFHDYLLEMEDDYDENEEPEQEPEEPEKELIVNDELRNIFNNILSEVLLEFKADGIEFISFLDSLNVAVTDRLKIRKFVTSDVANLHKIMKNPKVMYAWGQGFKKKEVRAWINNQLDRYQKDGYGYFAVTLKDTDKLVGQVGFFRSEIDGKEVVELGYIFNDVAWGKGYCTEAGRACTKLAFEQYGIEKLYCTIRPENEPSIKIAKQLGMILVGEYVKIFNDKEMPRMIYSMENK